MPTTAQISKRHLILTGTVDAFMTGVALRGVSLGDDDQAGPARTNDKLRNLVKANKGNLANLNRPDKQIACEELRADAPA